LARKLQLPPCIAFAAATSPCLVGALLVAYRMAEKQPHLAPDPPFSESRVADLPMGIMQVLLMVMHDAGDSGV